MCSRSTLWLLCSILTGTTSAQVPEVQFPDIDPLHSYPLPPLGLLEPSCAMDVVDVRYSQSGEERQTLHLIVQLLPNGIRRITVTVHVRGIPEKRPHHWHRSASLNDLFYIPPKKRHTNVYHYKKVNDTYRPCTKRGRIIRPWETYTVGGTTAVWDTTVYGDSLFLNRVHTHNTDSSHGSFFREVWSHGRLRRTSFGTRELGSERIHAEHSYAYSGDSVVIVHRQHGTEIKEFLSVVHAQRNAQGNLAEVERTFRIPMIPSSEKVRRTRHLLDHDNQGRLTCMAEYRDGGILIRSLIMNYR